MENEPSYPMEHVEAVFSKYLGDDKERKANYLNLLERTGSISSLMKLENQMAFMRNILTEEDYYPLYELVIEVHAYFQLHGIEVQTVAALICEEFKKVESDMLERYGSSLEYRDFIVNKNIERSLIVDTTILLIFLKGVNRYEK